MEDIEEINIANFQTIIENYEKIINELSNDIAFFKNEHLNLKLKISGLINENKKLSQELNELLASKDNFTVLYSREQNELIDNLKKQISALIEEKDCTTKLWQNSVKTIDSLEDEIKIFQAGTQEFIPKNYVIKIKKNYEEKISFLETNLRSTQKKLESISTTYTKDMGAKHQEIDKTLESQAGAFKIVHNLEEEVLNLQKRLQESEKIRGKLDKRIKDCEVFIQDVKQKNAECRDKVKEAVEVVTAALIEKDGALYREKEARDEVQRINDQLSEIIKETQEKIKNEVGKIKMEYSFSKDQLMKDLRKAEDEIRIKSLEIEKYSTKCKLLENEIEKVQKGKFTIDDSTTSKLLILEKNLESTFQKLLSSEKHNIQLISERETIKNDMEQMAGHYERTIKTKEVEKLTLQNQVKQLQASLDESNSNLLRLSEKNTGANDKLDTMEREYHTQKKYQERLIRQSYEEKISEINCIYSKNIRDLQAELESKTEVNKRWISETKEITENLEKLISDLKVEIHSLRKENGKLKQKLKECNAKVEQYKVFIQLLSKDVNKISNMAVGIGDIT